MRRRLQRERSLQRPLRIAIAGLLCCSVAILARERYGRLLRSSPAAAAARYGSGPREPTPAGPSLRPGPVQGASGGAPLALASPASPAARAALQRGGSALEKGLLATAVRSFEDAVQLAPGSALAHDWLGIAYLQQHRLGLALRHFREVVRLEPGSPYGWARIADVYHAQGNLKQAIAALERATAVEPQLAQLQSNLGMLYVQAMELGKGAEALRRCVALQPRDHSARFVLGGLLYKLAELDGAEREFEEAIRQAPGVGLYHFGLAQVCLRRSPSAPGMARARAELTRALALGLQQPAEAHYYLGVCYQRERQWEPAVKELQSSVKLAPEAWSAQYALSEVLQQLGRPEEARRALARFRELRAREDARMERSFYVQEAQRNPDSPDAQFQLAAALAERRDFSGARRALASARALASEKPGGSELRQRIAALSVRLARGQGRPR